MQAATLHGHTVQEQIMWWHALTPATLFEQSRTCIRSGLAPGCIRRPSGCCTGGWVRVQWDLPPCSILLTALCDLQWLLKCMSTVASACWLPVGDAL